MYVHAYMFYLPMLSKMDKISEVAAAKELFLNHSSIPPSKLISNSRDDNNRSCQ